MESNKIIRKIVLTGGPAAGKTTLLSRLIKEFTHESGWRVITVPESATDLIAGFGIKPFDNCLSMLAFQDFVIADQIHREKLALDAAKLVPEQKILIVYDRALMDDKAYITDEEFAEVLYRFDGRTEATVLENYDAVIHLVTCAKGAEFAYNLDNAARTETPEYAREMDDRILRAWSGHTHLKVIDNSVNFEVKINRALKEIRRAIGEEQDDTLVKTKFLIEMPDLDELHTVYNALPLEMMQTYLVSTPEVDRRIRQQRNGTAYLYFYTEKHFGADGERWDTEKPISGGEYVKRLMEGDPELHSVHKTKYRFTANGFRFEVDSYPFSKERAILFRYAPAGCDYFPDGIKVLKEVTGNPDYKNKQLARTQQLL